MDPGPSSSLESAMDYAFPDDTENRQHVREKQRLELLEQIQEDENTRLVEIYRSARRAPDYQSQDFNATTNRNINRPVLDSSCRCIMQQYQIDSGNQATNSDAILLAGSKPLGSGNTDETMDLREVSSAACLDLADTSLSNMPVADESSIYSNLNNILVNSQSLYNKQRQVRITHHIRELQYHTQMLMNSTTRPDLLKDMIHSEKSPHCPVHSSPVSSLSSILLPTN